MEHTASVKVADNDGIIRVHLWILSFSVVVMGFSASKLTEAIVILSYFNPESSGFNITLNVCKRSYMHIYEVLVA